MKSLIFTKGGLKTLDYFSEQLQRAATDAGYESTVADVSVPLGGQEFVSWLEEGRDCAVILFNNVGLGISAGDENLWEAHQVPVCNIVVDHPRAFHRYLLNPVRNLHLYCVDRNHVRYAERFYPGVQASFLPHGGNEPKERMPYAERPIDVLYVGSCQKEPPLYHIEQLPDQGAAFYRFVIPLLMQDDTIPCEEAIRRYLEQSGLARDDSLERTLNETVADACERYVRRRHKKQILAALAQAGLRVEVYGDQWTDEGEAYGDLVRIHERVSSSECMELMGRSKIALNIMPWFKDGSHERVYNAMLSGALSVTDDSVYLREMLADRENVIFYDRTQPEALAARMKELLADTDEAWRIAENGYRHAREKETWALRLRTLLRDLE